MDSLKPEGIIELTVSRILQLFNFIISAAAEQALISFTSSYTYFSVGQKDISHLNEATGDLVKPTGYLFIIPPMYPRLSISTKTTGCKSDLR